MKSLKEIWHNADTKKRSVIIFFGLIFVYILIYISGNLMFQTLKPASPEYLVARTSTTDITDVDVKKTTDTWNIPGTKAKNVSKQKLTVGQQVKVQRYWWFGHHTFVKDVVLK